MTSTILTDSHHSYPHLFPKPLPFRPDPDTCLLAKLVRTARIGLALSQPSQQLVSRHACFAPNADFKCGWERQFNVRIAAETVAFTVYGVVTGWIAIHGKLAVAEGNGCGGGG